LENARSGMCLDAPLEQPEGAGFKVSQRRCDADSFTQLWTGEPVDGSHRFRIRNRQHGRCLDIRRADTRSGARLLAWPCANTWNQVWWQSQPRN